MAAGCFHDPDQGSDSVVGGPNAMPASGVRSRGGDDQISPAMHDDPRAAVPSRAAVCLLSLPLLR